MKNICFNKYSTPLGLTDWVTFYPWVAPMAIDIEALRASFLKFVDQSLEGFLRTTISECFNCGVFNLFPNETFSSLKGFNAIAMSATIDTS